MRLFKAQGYNETSIEQIAEAAEVSPSTFFRYFPTKEEVVLADDIDPIVLQVLAEQPADLPPMQAIRLAVAAVFEQPTRRHRPRGGPAGGLRRPGTAPGDDLPALPIHRHDRHRDRRPAGPLPRSSRFGSSRERLPVPYLAGLCPAELDGPKVGPDGAFEGGDQDRIEFLADGLPLT